MVFRATRRKLPTRGSVCGSALGDGGNLGSRGCAGSRMGLPHALVHLEEASAANLSGDEINAESKASGQRPTVDCDNQSWAKSTAHLAYVWRDAQTWREELLCLMFRCRISTESYRSREARTAGNAQPEGRGIARRNTASARVCTKGLEAF
jgi:hypothetical protein